MPVVASNGVDAGILRFSNRHVSVLDVDADGLVNLVHMPDSRTYTVFSPKSNGGGWGWSAKTVSAPAGQDVKIDWTKNAEHTAVMDVNGDGLVDVVYASATEMQTFLALGRYPGGQDQFGHAEWISATEAKLSTEPVKACVPWNSAPVRLGDKDVHVADMNADGLPDIVRIRNGQVLYWPGRGNGTWGTGNRSDCSAGSFGSERAITMQNAPQLNSLDSSEFFTSDVNGDGLTDLVKVRVNAVDLYLNENGLGFTARGVLSDTPVHPNGTRRVALTDINGSGTPDILWGEARNYQYIDLTGGVQPLLLKRVHNGLGATTELDYRTSTQLMLDAVKAGKPWTSVMPTAVPVVVRSTARDNLEQVKRPGGAIVTEYQYRDPVFDGKSRDFRGFRETVVRAVGDANSPTLLKRSVFLLGHPSDDQSSNTSAVDSNASDTEELWREAVKGLPVIEEEMDETGVTRFTRHTAVSIKDLYQGLDGRRVLARPISTVNVFAYDVANFDHNEGTVSIADYSIDVAGVQRQFTRQLQVRATSGTATMRSATVQDSYGNVTTSLKEGCISGCPAGADESITTTSVFERPSGDLSGWLWRESESYVTGSAHPTPRHRRGNKYNANGEVVETHAWLSGTLGLQRTTAVAPPNASAGQASEALLVLSETTYDGLGNPAFTQGPLGACHAIDVDPLYAEFVVTDNAFAGDASFDGCGDRMFTTSATYDRGLGLPLTVTSPRNQPSQAEYDGFGRILAEFGPSVDAPTTLDSRPRKIYEYYPTTNPVTQPYSVLRTQTIDEDSNGAVGYVEDVGYVDGLGRTLYALSEADPGAGDGGKYVVGGDTQYNAKGMPYLSHEPDFHAGPAMPLDVSKALATNTKRQVYDAFGRVREVYLQDGQLKSSAYYHALGADSFDAGDLSSDARYSGSFTSQYSDGHGRSVLGVSRYKLNNTTVEEHRTVASYLPSGEVAQITQQRAGSPDFVRHFEYDSWGRMVLNVDPNTSVIMGSGASMVTKAWRYAYDDASHLVGTSDANGCGVNYHYDAGGRLIGSDYLPCKANHVSYSAPNASTGDGFETFYRYDEPDPLATNITDAAGQTLTVESPWLWGRLASVKTRGGFNVFAYDPLGRTTGVARRIAKPGNVSPMISERYTPRWYVKQATYDIANRPRRVSTGAPLLALFGSDGTSEQRITYTRRGLVRNIGSSYGTLLAQETRDARGLVKDVVFGDLAQTTRSYSYNELTQVSEVTTYRAPASIWTSPASPYTAPPTTPNPTTQLTLEHYEFKYDVMGNLNLANDWRTASEWPDTNRPVTRTWDYDSYSRLTKTTYAYAGTSNTTWQAPFAPENVSSELEPRPANQVSYGSRIQEETFSYDWLNNLVANTDDSNGFYDRSIGTVSYVDASRPHRLTGASNRATGSSRAGELAVAYDDVGQVTAMVLQREGTCLPSGTSCWARFAYEWGEVGSLVRARRWDLAAGSERTTYGSPSSVNAAHPTRTPDAEMNYQYDGGSRIVKSATRPDGESGPETKYTVYPFSTLELRSTTLSGSGATEDYALTTDTTQLRLSGGAVSGRVLYNATMPRTGASNVHLFLEFGDHLGSTTFTVDHATSEVVEYVSYTAYGQTENDYRTSRWSNFREPYRFTGKEEDTEVGLNYHGARYYSPVLKRWMSADPVTVHEAGSDINPYAYGYGNPTGYVDPDGRSAIAVFVIAAVVNATINIVVQQQTTGHVNWGWNGVLGAAVGGGIMAVGGPPAAFAVSYIQTRLRGGSPEDALRNATISVAASAGGSLFSGGIIDSVAASGGTVTPGVQFAAGLAGTAVGTQFGVVAGAALGQEPTWGSVGASLGTAFASAIATTVLGNAYQAVTEANTAGEAAGTASGKTRGGPSAPCGKSGSPSCGNPAQREAKMSSLQRKSRRSRERVAGQSFASRPLQKGDDSRLNGVDQSKAQSGIDCGYYHR